MKLVIVLCVLSCLLWECQSSPVQLVENHELLTKEKAHSTGRQQNAASAASSDDEDDDDDDDDEDDLESLVDDDDDDDDDDDSEESQNAVRDSPAAEAQQVAASAVQGSSTEDDDDDDDDDDYLERLFDDILDDDDDDDDDDSVAQSVSKPVAQAAQPVVQAVAVPPAPAVAEAAEVIGAGLSADYPIEGEQSVFYDESESSGIDTKIDTQSLNKPSADNSGTGQNTAQMVDNAVAGSSDSLNSLKLQQTQQQQQSGSSVIQNANPAVNEINSNDSDNDDDDDDDEEDEIAGALTGDDDDDDDDDDDELIGDDVIEARHTRSIAEEKLPAPMQEIITDRYNRFVDTIFDSINKILRSQFDPVRVRLASKKASSTTNPSEKTKNADKHKKTKITKTNSKGRSNNEFESNGIHEVQNSAKLNVNNLSDEINEDDINLNQSEGVQSKMIESSVSGTFKSSGNTNKIHNQSNLQQQRIQHYNKHKSTSTSSSNTGNIKHKTKQASGTHSGFQSNDEKPKRAQGTLYGMASLKRVGNVKVTPDTTITGAGKNSTIKARFTLGPLTLRVEKSFKRGSNRTVRSATAKTNELIGRITLRVIDGAATLQAIKVQQPKQVRVESSDNHERTREFIWKRTPQIAHLVSEQLTIATESLLEPPVGTKIEHI